jgi:uncharacterized protein DUF3592
LKTESASAVGHEQTALLRQSRIARLTVIVSCVILIPIFVYSLLQNRIVSRLKLSGIATSARLTEKKLILDHYWNSRRIDEAIIRFKYKVESGKTFEGWQRVRGPSVANLSDGDEFSVWYDRARPDRVLTPWNDGGEAVETRIMGFIVGLLVTMVAVFAVTRWRKPAQSG